MGDLAISELFLEVFVIVLPIFIHAVYGLYIAFTAKYSVKRLRLLSVTGCLFCNGSQDLLQSSLLLGMFGRQELQAAFGAMSIPI